MILGIDPSYTRSGIALIDNHGQVLFTENISANKSVYDSILTMHEGAMNIVSRITQIIDEEFHLDNLDVIVEYPALATKSGAYLAVLNGYLASALYSNDRIKSVTWVPPTACDSYSKNKGHSKTYLVNFCKNKGWIEPKSRISHDICTAIILCNLLLAIRDNSYKNSFFTWLHP